MPIRKIVKMFNRKKKFTGKQTGKNTFEWDVKSKKKFTGKQIGKNTFEWDIKPEQKTLFNKVKEKLEGAKIEYIRKHNERVNAVNDILKTKIPLNVLDNKVVKERMHYYVELYGGLESDKTIASMILRDYDRAKSKSKGKKLIVDLSKITYEEISKKMEQNQKKK